IRASHIKPWKDANDKERLDPYNGLPLIASLDALFDAGLISFKSSGEMITSSSLSESEKEIFGLHELFLTMQPHEKTISYLAYHRENVFKE
ncbi:MAG: HNH endonuclease, partial [Bacteroidetes bacterium]